MEDQAIDQSGGCRLTWPALLANWMDFARSAVALPRTSDGDRWRESVAPIITLSAVTHALRELDMINDSERPLALDRAEILCRDASARLNDLWRGAAMPPDLIEIVEDSRVAFEHAANAGVEWIVASDRLTCPHPIALIERLGNAGFAGDLFVPSPGVELFRTSVCAFARGPGGSRPAPEAIRLIERHLTQRGGRVRPPSRAHMPRQVYRQMNFATGAIARDLIVPLHHDLPAGQPLLVLAIERGEACAIPPERTVSPIANPPPVECADGT